VVLEWMGLVVAGGESTRACAECRRGGESCGVLERGKAVSGELHEGELAAFASCFDSLRADIFLHSFSSTSANPRDRIRSNWLTSRSCWRSSTRRASSRVWGTRKRELASGRTRATERARPAMWRWRSNQAVLYLRSPLLSSSLLRFAFVPNLRSSRAMNLNAKT
jgi:hypothetical protein